MFWGLDNREEYPMVDKRVKELKITAITAQYTNIKRLDSLMGKVVSLTIVVC